MSEPRELDVVKLQGTIVHMLGEHHALVEVGKEGETVAVPLAELEVVWRFSTHSATSKDPK